MKKFVLLFFFLINVGMANGQVTGGGIVTPIPRISIPAYGPSMSVIDRNGHLLIFDVSYSYPAPVPRTSIASRIPVTKTRLTVVRNNGRKDAPVEFDGAVQVVGAGYYAVYVILSRTAITPASEGQRPAIATTRQLLAINLDLTTQPTPLDVPQFAEVALSASIDSRRPDTLSFVDRATDPRILAPAARRFARIITCDGRAFSSSDPIPVP